MKRKFVAFLLIMAMCANGTTTVFAEDVLQNNDVASLIQGNTPSTGQIVTSDINTATVITDTQTSSEDSGKGSTSDILINNNVSDTITMEGGDATPDAPSIGTGSSVMIETELVEEEKKAETETEVKEEPVVGSTENTVTEEVKKEDTKKDNKTPQGQGTVVKDAIVGTVNATFRPEVVEDDTDEKEEETESKLAKEQQAIVDYAKSIGYTDGRKWREKGDDMSKLLHEYAEEPVIGKDSCTAGKLADSTLKEGLDLINLIRKVAGLGEVTLDDTYNDYAQHGALVMAAEGVLDHFPLQIDNITDDQFKLGYKGTTGGNIGQGHRRWILNPTMTKVGFGQVGEFNDMYAHDNSGKNTITDFIAWPAQNTPTELLPYSAIDGHITGTPWSCSLGSDYKIVPSKELTITVTSANGTTVEIPNSNITCNNQKYGYTNGCIIFSSNEMKKLVDYSDGQSYTVKIDGVMDKKGNRTKTWYLSI